MSFRYEEIYQKLSQTRLDVLSSLHSQSDEISQFKIQSEVIATYVASEAILSKRLKISQGVPDSGLEPKLEEFSRLISNLNLSVHIKFDITQPTSGKARLESGRYRVFNEKARELYSNFTPLNKTIVKEESINQDKLVDGFKPYLEDEWAFTKFKEIDNKISELATKFRSYRLPNVLITLKRLKNDDRPHYLLCQTYNIFFKNYDIAGVLYVSKAFTISQILYQERNRERQLIWPTLEEVDNLQSLLEHEYQHAKQLRRINGEIDGRLYETFEQEKALRHKFIQEIVNNRIPIPKISRLVSRADFPIGLILNDGVLTIEAVSDGVLDFWGLLPEEVQNESLLEFYRKTYHKRAIEAEARMNKATNDNDRELARLEKSHLYESIAKQLRHLVLARNYEVPISIPIFFRKDNKVWKVVRKVEYAQKDSPFIILTLETSSDVDSSALKTYLHTRALDERDPISGLKTTFEYSKQAYEFVLKILDEIERKSGKQTRPTPQIVNDAVDNISKKLFTEYENARIAFEFSEEFLLNKRKLRCSEAFIQQFCIDENNGDFLESIKSRVRKNANESDEEIERINKLLAEEYTNVLKLAKACGGTCRLSNITFKYCPKNDKGDLYCIEFIYSFAVYFNRRFVGIAYVAGTETFAMEERTAYQQRWLSLSVFSALISRSTVTFSDQMSIKDILREIKEVNDTNKNYILADALEVIQSLTHSVETQIKKLYPEIPDDRKIGLVNVDEEKPTHRRYFQYTDGKVNKKIRIES